MKLDSLRPGSGKWKEVVENAKTFNWKVQRLEEEKVFFVGSFSLTIK
jgi:hypothetical protein